MAAAMVSIEYEARFQKLQSDMGKVLSLVQNNAHQMSRSVATVGEGAKSAGSGIEAMQAHLLGWRKEATQEGRAATFFAAQIEKIGVVSKETGGILSEMASGFAFGGALGVATEIVKIAVGAYLNLGKEAKAAGEALTKAGAEATKAWSDYAQSLTDASAARKIYNQVAGKQESELDAANFRRQSLKEEIAKLQEVLALRDDLLKQQAAEIARTGMPSADIAVRIGKADNPEAARQLVAARKELADLEKKHPALSDFVARQQDELKAAEKIAAKARGDELLKGDQKKLQQLEAEHQAVMQQIAAGALEGRLKIEAEGAAKIAEIRKRFLGAPADALGMRDQEIEAERKAVKERIRLYEIEQKAKESAGVAALLNEEEKRIAKGREKLPLDIAEDNTEEARRLARAWQKAGSEIAGSMDAIGSAIGGAAGEIASYVGKMIQQAIQLAVAIAAASGPLGWLNAAAAAATLIATIGSVPEFRAMGGSVSAGRPYVVGERGPELMVPGQSGSIVPNHALGGITYNVTINATDAGSFFRANRRTMLAEITRATRAGES